MYSLDEILRMSVEEKASDIHFTAGCPPYYRIDGVLTPLKGDKLLPTDLETLLLPILDNRHRNELETNGQTDLAYAIPGVGRFRVNVYKQRGTLASAMRCLPFSIPDADSLGIPAEVQALTAKKRGLVLVTGPTGSGKSTTLASLVDIMNRKYPYHIITLEDPIEYLHRHQYSMVNQREIGSDSNDYAQALRAALREDPDVILVGEMRDYETISAALLAAETGHLVLSTLHTTGAAQTVERIIDACPAEGQNQVRIQLAGTLKGIVSQCLIPCGGGVTRIAATELLVSTDSILNLIREGKTHQIPSMMQVGADNGMHTLNMDLGRLVREGYITREDALSYTNNKAEIAQYL